MVGRRRIVFFRGFLGRGARFLPHLEAHFRRADTPNAAVFDTCAVHGTEADASQISFAAECLRPPMQRLLDIPKA